MKPAIPASRYGRPLVVMAALLMFLITQPALAATKYWVGPNPDNLWTNPNNWSLTAGGPGGAGEPGAGDVASLRQNDAINRMVRYNSTTNPPLAVVLVDATGAGTITLMQLWSSLSANEETIGYFGTGSFNQWAGTNTVKNTLSLGREASGIGTYSLKGGKLTAMDEAIGAYGTGNFTQSGGTHEVFSDFILGSSNTGKGTYNLNGGHLKAAREYIGHFGAGSFTQSGGENVIPYGLYVGVQKGGNGDYDLKGGSLGTGVDEVIGNSGTGTFTQSGGSNTVNQKLTLGLNSDSNGTYKMKGGSLSANDVSIGDSGTGTFTQTGGSHTVTKELTLGLNPYSSGTYNLEGGSLSAYYECIGKSGTGEFNQTLGNKEVFNIDMGENPDSKGTYHMKGGSLSADGERIGYYGIGTFTQSGGTHRVNGYLNIGVFSIGKGTYNLEGGYLRTSSADIGNDGTGIFNQSGLSSHTVDILSIGNWFHGKGNYTLNSGTLRTDFTRVGDYGLGTFTHFDGNHFSEGLTLGCTTHFGYYVGHGTYHLIGGTLQADEECIGSKGTGVFNQSGGTNKVINLSLGSLISYVTGNGSYTMTNGTLQAVREDIGVDGIGEFTQAGGQNTTNELALAVNAGSQGTYNLKGGTLTTKNIKINSGGSFNVDNVVTTVTGNVVNEGKVKTTGATVTWNGNFTNNNEYKSDPSTQTFANDLKVGLKGYLVGYSQDLFIVKNDFKNQSTQTTKWNTVEAGLQFATGADNRHFLYIPGADTGPPGDVPVTAVTGKFAWGNLDITGQIVTLMDGSADSGGALYVGWIKGAEPLYTKGKLQNILAGGSLELNIYYDPDLSDNAYLLGGTYSWGSGQGHLMPYHTPVPASVLLLGSGLLGLGLLGRRRQRG